MTNMILEGIEKNYNWGNQIIVSCDLSLYPSLYLLINGYWVEIHPETFITSFDKNYSETNDIATGCYLSIKPGD
jgi:hypothetical protein